MFFSILYLLCNKKATFQLYFGAAGCKQMNKKMKTWPHQLEERKKGSSKKILKFFNIKGSFSLISTIVVVILSNFSSY